MTLAPHDSLNLQVINSIELKNYALRVRDCLK